MSSLHLRELGKGCHQSLFTEGGVIKPDLIEDVAAHIARRKDHALAEACVPYPRAGGKFLKAESRRARLLLRLGIASDTGGAVHLA